MSKPKSNAEVIMSSINRVFDEVFSWSGENITLERRTSKVSEITFADGTIVIVRCTERKPGEASRD